MVLMRTLDQRNASLALAVFGAIALACGISGPSNPLGPTQQDPNHLFDYNHGAKILVQYIPSKDETNVYHYIPRDDVKYKDPPFKPRFLIAGRTITGKHSIELFDMVSFSGSKPSSIPTNTALTVIHGIVNRNDWHFPPNAQLVFKADDEQFGVPVRAQMQLQKDEPSDLEFYETLIAEPSYEMYSKIGKARRVTISIGAASFELTPEYIASYATFVKHLTPPTLR